jgi:DNA-binding MarR family transcriptional regulator
MSGARHKQKPAPPRHFEVPRHFLGFEIVQLAHLKKTRDDALFRASVGIGLTQYRLLDLLNMAPGLGAGQLARWLLIAPQSTATLIIELWKMGLVKKDEKRRRGERVRVTLTPKGRALLKRARVPLEQTRREVREPLSKREVQVFTRLMNRVNDHYIQLSRTTKP